MTKIGFHRKEGAGSSVRFDPDEDIGGNSISFHRYVSCCAVSTRLADGF